MPVFDTPTRTKIDALRAIRAADNATNPYEAVKINWPAPDGAISYSVLDLQSVADEYAVTLPAEIAQYDIRIIPEDETGEWFSELLQDASIGDEEVNLNFWDADGVISDLLIAHGEGIKVEFFYWFPQVELLLLQWQGHLRNEEEAKIDVLPVTIAQGFRSGESDVPGRAHYQQCQAVFGGVLTTQAEIDEHDCPYNLHIGGATGIDNPATSAPWTFCNRLNLQSCTDRGINTNFHLSHNTISVSVANNQTSGTNLLSTSRGNETNLKDPVRVIMGERTVYDFPVIAYRRDLNNNNPDHGWFAALYEVGEGPIHSIRNVVIHAGNRYQAAAPIHYAFRDGTKGQAPLITTITTHAYSGVAHHYYNFGWIDPRTVGPEDMGSEATVVGLRNIRIYTDDDTYTESSTTNRAWQIMRVLCDKRWGFGYDYARLNKTSWIAAATWCAQAVRFTDFAGATYDHVRSRSDVDLNGKKVQEQIEDMCMAGRLSRPFLFDGEIHIEPLRTLTTGELAACPVFTDEGNSPNIIWEGDGDNAKSTLTISRKSDLDLPNRVECTFDDGTQGHLEMPVRPVEDVDAQLRAGRVIGDGSRKVNTKKYQLLGVTVEAQAVKMAWSLLDLGPFDEGGLRNNLTVKFQIWYLDSLDLHPFKVIKVANARVQKYSFQYFRIMRMTRQANLIVEVECQAYNETYMATFEMLTQNPGGGGGPIDPPIVIFPPIEPPVCRLDFGSVTHVDGVLRIPILEC